MLLDGLERGPGRGAEFDLVGLERLESGGAVGAERLRPLRLAARPALASPQCPKSASSSTISSSVVRRLSAAARPSTMCGDVA